MCRVVIFQMVSQHFCSWLITEIGAVALGSSDCCQEEGSGGFFCFDLHADRFVSGDANWIGGPVPDWNGAGFRSISSEVGIHGCWFHDE